MKQIKVPTETYSRVVGYFRPVYFGDKSGNWNKGKTEEFKERTYLKIPDLIEVGEESILSHS